MNGEKYSSNKIIYILKLFFEIIHKTYHEGIQVKTAQIDQCLHCKLKLFLPKVPSHNLCHKCIPPFVENISFYHRPKLQPPA